MLQACGNATSNKTVSGVEAATALGDYYTQVGVGWYESREHGSKVGLMDSNNLNNKLVEPSLHTQKHNNTIHFGTNQTYNVSSASATGTLTIDNS